MAQYVDRNVPHLVRNLPRVFRLLDAVRRRSHYVTFHLFDPYGEIELVRSALALEICERMADYTYAEALVHVHLEPNTLVDESPWIRFDLTAEDPEDVVSEYSISLGYIVRDFLRDARKPRIYIEDLVSGDSVV